MAGEMPQMKRAEAGIACSAGRPGFAVPAVGSCEWRCRVPGVEFWSSTAPPEAHGGSKPYQALDTRHSTSAPATWVTSLERPSPDGWRMGLAQE
jgi:hypothetical protein